MLRKKQIMPVVSVSVALFLAAGCHENPTVSEKDLGPMPLASLSDDAGESAPAPLSTATDYSDMSNWSVFTSADNLTKDVDMFLLYPTSIFSSAAEDCPYADINNTSMRAAVDRWLRGLGRIPTEHTNPFLPYYRQANVFGGCPTGGPRPDMTGGAAMEDVIAAFRYYLDNINKGERPFILFGFSQGSSPLWELAVNRLDTLGGEVLGAANRKNHIITYAVGIPSRSAIDANRPVRFSQTYNDINVITSWNSYWESDTVCAQSRLGVRAWSGPTTNPITWTTDETYYAMTENPTLDTRSILGAQVHNGLGILLVRRRTPTSAGCGADAGGGGGVYMGEHGNDVPYFSASIIKNIEDRIAAWYAVNASMSVLGSNREIPRM